MTRVKKLSGRHVESTLCLFDSVLVVTVLLGSFSIRLGYWYWPNEELLWIIFGAPVVAIPIFIIDGAIIGVLGSLLGGLISGLAGLYMSLNQVAFAGGLILEITFDANTLLSPLLIGFMLSILASIYPAWKASRYHPTEAMRYV